MDENSSSRSSSDSVELKVEPYVNGHMETEPSYTERIEDHGQPFVENIEQPQQRGFRFRYECEGPSHGGLQGNNSEKFRKTVPTIKIRNWNGPSRVLVSLVTDESVPKPHAHKLVGKHCKEGICITEVRAGTPQIAFPNLCIQHVTRKKAADVLQHRIIENIVLEKRRQLGDYSSHITVSDDEKQRAHREAAASAKNMQLNVVRLCFQAFLLDNEGKTLQLLPSVVSEGIFDSKSPGANALKICRMDKYSGCCTGNEEVFLLCEKVQREDISVRFVEQDKDGNVIWNAYGNFGPCDVHRQYAIVFKTPEYRDTEIKSPVNVLVMLQRKSDKESSDPKSFTYYPKTLDKEEIYRKRKKTFPWSGGGGNNNFHTFDPPNHFGGGGGGGGGDKNSNSNGNASNGLQNGGTLPDLDNLSHLPQFGHRPIRLRGKGSRPPYQQVRRTNRLASPSHQPVPQPVDVIENPSQFMFEEVSHLSPMSGTGHISDGTSPPYINGGSPSSLASINVTSPYNSGTNMSGSPHSTTGSMSSPYQQGAVSPQQLNNPASPHANNRSPIEMSEQLKFGSQQAGLGVPLSSTISESIPGTQTSMASTMPTQMDTCFPAEVTCESFVQPVQTEPIQDLETDFFPGPGAGNVSCGMSNVQYFSNQYGQPGGYAAPVRQTLPEIENDLANIMQMYGAGPQMQQQQQPQTCGFQARGSGSTNYIQGLDDITGLDFFDGKRRPMASQGYDEPDSALFKAPEISRQDYPGGLGEPDIVERREVKQVLLGPAESEPVPVQTAVVTRDTGSQAGGGHTENRGVQTEMDPTLRMVTKTAGALQQYAASGDVRALLMVQRFLMTVSDYNGDLPLHTSLINLKYEVFQNLLDVMVTLPDYSARINAYNFLHQTPLHLAVLTNQPYAIDLLLRAGADTTLVDRNGYTPAHLAVLYKRDQCLKTLLKYLRPNVAPACPFPELNIKCYDGFTAAHLAAQTDNLAAMKLLMFGKADVNLADGKSGKTALHHVVEADELSIAAYLILQAGAEVNKKSFDGNTALHLACGRGNVGMVALLMAGGADPNIENDEVESDTELAADSSSGEEGAPGAGEDADKDRDVSEEKGARGRDEVDGQGQEGAGEGASQEPSRGLRPEDYADGNEKILRILNGEPYTSLKADEAGDDETDGVPGEEEGGDNSVGSVTTRLSSLKMYPVHDSGVASLGITSTKGDMERVSFPTRKCLSDLLDQPGVGGADWRALADKLGLKKCLEGNLGQHSPTRMLLNYYEENGGTVSRLSEALLEVKRADAARLLENLDCPLPRSPSADKGVEKDENIDSGLESIQHKSQLSA